MDGISLLVGIILGAALGAAIGWFIAKSRFQHPGKNQDDMREIIGLKEELARKNEQMIALSEKLDFQKQEVAALQKQFKIEFENLANKILEEKSQKFTEQNKTNLDIVLNPLKEKIEKFEKSVTEKYVKEAEGRSALGEQIRQLSDLNKQMTEEAANLTKALKGDSKTQGDWGEIQLEIILEKAGLLKDVHFSTQATFRDDDGNLKKPDFIIHLPENKCLVIDSKVSLTAYEAFMSSDDEDERAVQLKAHMHSLRDHIKELSAKNYQQLHQINTPEHVLMYIPIEPAFILAVQENNNLFLEAFDRNVILVTTSTLLATMTTVSSIWKQEDQKKNALEIARQGGALYDKFVMFVEELVKAGKKLDDAKDSYSEAMKHLVEGKGNLVRRTENLKELGAKASKSIPENIVERSSDDDDEPQLQIEAS